VWVQYTACTVQYKTCTVQYTACTVHYTAYTVTAVTRGLQTFRIGQDYINENYQTSDTTLSLCNGTNYYT